MTSDIDTTYGNTASGQNYGIHVRNTVGGANSDIDITVRDSSVDTTSRAITGFRQNGSGDIDIDIFDTTITTNNIFAYGIYGWNRNTGDITINTRNADITTESTALDAGINFSAGVYAIHTGSEGDITIDVRDGSIATKGAYSYAIYGAQRGDGEVTIITDSENEITTTGANGHGIVAYQHSTTATPRLMDITVGGSIDVSGAGAQGVRVGTVSSAGVPSRVATIGSDGYRRQTVTVNGSIASAAEGVYLANGGKVVIGPRGTITSGSGVAILATGTVAAVMDDPATMGVDESADAITPKLRVDMNLNGRRVADVIGDDWIINDGGETTIVVNNVVLHEGATGNTGRTARNGAWNVRMRAEGVKVTDRTTDPNPENWTISDPAADVIADRDFSADDFNRARRRCPSGQVGTPPNCRTPPPPMPRKVVVDKPISGDVYSRAGVLLQAGGEVYIGPEGMIGAQSGVAILSTGKNPKLLVDMNLNGRRVNEVLGDNWIISDGGETTIVVNDVKLHDGATGVVPDAVAPNGAWNVTIRAEGVKVINRPGRDQSEWVITEPSANVFADRDFSATDFNETRKPPPMCPDGQVGTPPNCETSPPPIFDEVYAPRAALYEALPGFLLRLTGRGPAGAGSRPGRLAFPESPVYVRFSGGGGTSAPARSSVGVDYDFHRVQAELGVNLSSPAPWAHGLTGSLAVRHTQGSTTVTAPTGGGSLDAQGLGVAFGLAYQGAGGAYFNGWGLVSHYTVDVASDTEGWLKRNAGVLAHAFGLETGHRVRLTDETHLTPRVWLVRSDLSMDRFTDAVDSRVALQAAEHLAGGLGLLAATRYVWAEEQTLALRGSVDVEQAFNDRETVVDVSGEALTSDSKNTRVLVGLGGAYQWGRFSVSSEVSVGGLDVSDQEFFGQLTLGLRF